MRRFYKGAASFAFHTVFQAESGKDEKQSRVSGWARTGKPAIEKGQPWGMAGSPETF